MQFIKIGMSLLLHNSQRQHAFCIIRYNLDRDQIVLSASNSALYTDFSYTSSKLCVWYLIIFWPEGDADWNVNVVSLNTSLLLFQAAVERLPHSL